MQAMEVNFADVLESGETLDKFMQASARGRGMAARSTDYVRPIAVRYVQSHCQHLLQLQTLRRETPTPATALTTAPATTSATVTTTTTINTTCTNTGLTNDLFNDDVWDTELARWCRGTGA